MYGRLPFLDGYDNAVESSVEEFESRLGEVRAFWKELLNKGMRINVPEQRVNDAYRAWLAYTFLNVDKIGDKYEPHDGSGFYEAIFGIMAAKYCNALGLTGYIRTRPESISTRSRRSSRRKALFRTGFGVVDTGALLLVMARHYQLTGDERWLREVAPHMIKMCGWIIKTRKEVKAAREKDSVCYGLISSNLGVDNPGADYSYLTDTSPLCRDGAARGEPCGRWE